MTFQVSQILFVVRRRSLISALIFAVFGFLIFPFSTNAQAGKGTSVTKRLQRFGLTRVEVKPLLPVIEKQTESLAKIYDKYSKRSEVEYILVSTTTRIWDDLKANRQSLTSVNDRKLTRRQNIALRSVYSELEKETVMLLLDDEVPMWGEELELSDRQLDELYDICVSDITRKQLLIDKPFGAEMIGTKIKAVSEDTERRILKMLFPDQRIIWEKSRQRNVETELKTVA